MEIIDRYAYKIKQFSKALISTKNEAEWL